jgi:hypothetical protein
MGAVQEGWFVNMQDQKQTLNVAISFNKTTPKGLKMLVCLYYVLQASCNGFLRGFAFWQAKKTTVSCCLIGRFRLTCL